MEDTQGRVRRVRHDIKGFGQLEYALSELFVVRDLRTAAEDIKVLEIGDPLVLIPVLNHENGEIAEVVDQEHPLSEIRDED